MIILMVLTVLVFVITLLGFLRLFWWCTVVDFFRLHYAIAALLLAGFSVAYGYIGLAILNVILAGANLYRMRHFLVFKRLSKVCADKDIMSINSYKENICPKRLGKIIGEADAKLLLLMEMTEELESDLSEVLERYPYSLKTPVRDGFSIHLYSKTEMDDAYVHFCTEGDTPLLCAKINVKGRDYQVYSAHPKPAFNKKWKEDRDDYFEEMKDFANKADRPVIILGDFNSVPWESHFTQFLKDTNLKSTLFGHGYRITWPAFFPLAGVPMDHILITKDIEYGDLCVGPFAGSDHFPISANLK